MMPKPIPSWRARAAIVVASLLPAATVGQAQDRALHPALPHDLSPVGMFLAADIVVKAVMLALLAASIATWSVWLSKVFELWHARREIRRDTDQLSRAASLSQALALPLRPPGATYRLASAASAEARISLERGAAAGIAERVGSCLLAVEAAEIRAMRSGLGVLASVGATAPFVGLFGTVWGIMNSFIGISKAQTTNLAIVAPGIAEALLATAIGLVAAIPAVLFYNQLARSIAVNRALLQDASGVVQRLASRDLDAGVPAARAAPIKLAAE